MNYTLTKQKNAVSVAFRSTAKEWEDAIERAYQDNKSKFSVPGFRKGKVPKSVVIRTYGEGVLYDDAFDRLFNDFYSEFLEKEPDVIPVDRPSLEVEELNADGVKFTATVAVQPDVTLGDYKSLKLTRADVKTTEADVDAEILRTRERAARKVAVTDRAAANGDVVNIDYVGTVGNQAFEGGTADRQELKLGSGMFIPGFEEQVVGMTLGEERDVRVTFPSDYMATDLAGKEANFKVKLNGIDMLEVPEANDAFAADVSKFDTFAEYRADVKARMEAAAAEEAKRLDENALLEAVTEISNVDVPEVMVEHQIDSFVKDLEYRLMTQGMKLEDYFAYTDSTLEDMRAARREDAEKAVKLRLVVEAIVKAEKLGATEEEMKARIESLASAAKVTVEKYLSTHAQQIQYIANQVMMDKLIAKLNEWTDWSGAPAKSAAKMPAAKKTSAAKKAASEKAPAPANDAE